MFCLQDLSLTWSFPSIEHRKFERNPLVAVVVQVRFHPILKTADRVSEFQERVRADFPIFLEGTIELVEFKPPDLVRSRKERQFSFRKEDGSCAITLGVEALALENRRHTGHEAFLKDVRLAFDTLVDIYKPVKPIRLGMRYINLIDREKISRDLKREVPWTDLITEDFLRMPVQLTSLDDTLFSSEINSRVDGGSLTLRYGLLRRDNADVVHFRFDTDRYVEGSLDPATMTDKLFAFVADEYAPFAKMIGPALLEWMGPIDEAKPSEGE